MRIPRSLGFVLQSIGAGLAVAALFLIVSPNQSGSERVVEVKESAAATPMPTMRVLSEGPVSYADAVASAAPAVVNIHTAKLITSEKSPFDKDPFLRRFFGDTLSTPVPQQQNSLGSGVIFSEQGYVLTSNHVIEKADQIDVMLRDGRSGAARVVGADPETDLAILKIDLDNLPAATFATRELAVGDVVLAIGNPFGVGQTVTMGIVSATGRSRLGINTFENFIQTDAAINPGNSGGALVNAYGQLIGINAAIFSPTGGSNGIGFAIPVDLAKDVLEQIIEQGYVARGWLGIEVQELTAASGGVLVKAVFRQGPADRAGIMPGDVVTHINDTPVNDARSALDVIAGIAPGHRVALQVMREGRAQGIEAVVSQRPKPQPS